MDTNCTNFHECRSTSKTVKVNWCKLVNGADGISEIEGKGRRGDRASGAGSEFQIRVSKASPKKTSIQMITLSAPFSFMAMKGNYRIRKNMNKTLAEKTARACRFP